METKTIAVVVMAIAIGIIGITTTIMSSATAQSINPPNGHQCSGLIAGCLPGQHINSNTPGGANILGNPHLPQTGGPGTGLPPVSSTGDPHSGGVCNPATGNPHADPTIIPPPGSGFGC